MSEWRERYDDSPGLASAFELLESYYHYGVIAILAGFMVWLRSRFWGRFLVDGEVLFPGNDPWYHYRQTLYTAAEHWPQTMPFEIYTNFPKGTAPGQFGTIYDQIAATIALVVGLGNPSAQLVALVGVFVPVLVAVATLIPAYYLGKRMGDRAGGVAAVLVVALTAGGFLTRSLAGWFDHHIAEAFFQALAIAGLAVALAVARREKPIFEQLLERDFDALRSTLGWSTLAGVGVALYVWAWPFGVVLVGILGIFVLLELSAEFLRGESPDHTAMVVAVSMSVTGVLLFAKLQILGFSPGDFTLLQPAMAFGLAAWALGMAWLARVWEARDLAAWQYPVAVVGVLAGLAVAAMIVTPGIFNLFAKNVLRIFGLGFTVSAEALSVGEIRPLRDVTAFFDWYKFAVFTSLAAMVWILGRFLAGRKVRAESFLVVVWTVFMTMATISQVRFSYYLAVPVAALTAYTVGKIVTDLSLQFDADIVKFYRIAGILALAAFLVVPMVLMAPTPVRASAGNGPGADIAGWSQSLEWMEGHTPAEGQFGDGNTTMEFSATHAITDDYDYPDGAYGVLSWWDYGHWITVQSQRIPVANPFQQHATAAANFLLAPNESQAADVLAGVSEDDAETRYVIADWKMANTYTNPVIRNEVSRINGKFFAPTRFYNASDVSQSDYWGQLYFERTTSSGPLLYSFNYRKQPYYESMVTRLYRFHGSAIEPNPVVIDWEYRQSQAAGNALPMTWSGTPTVSIEEFNTMSAAREFVRNESDGTSQVGGFGGNPVERVPALEHYRLVGTSEMSATRSGGYQASKSLTALGLGVNRSADQPYFDGIDEPWTKVFERVPGATVEGTGPTNATVTAYVEMRNEITDETFTYHQRVTTNAQGEFTMTLPYSTTGYDEWGPANGHTNVSVRATGPYTFVASSVQDGSIVRWNDTAHVSEGAVIGETNETVSVDLTRIQAPSNGGTNGSDASGATQPVADGSGTDGSGSDGSGSDASGTDGSGTDGSGAGTNGSGSAGLIAPVAGEP